MISVLFFLPTVLIICDKLIEKTTMKTHSSIRREKKMSNYVKTKNVKKASTFVLTTSILMGSVYPAFADTKYI